ncbi:MAG: hypothetical protein AAF790_04650, partial [Planctomycetota bacterium]
MTETYPMPTVALSRGGLSRGGAVCGAGRVALFLFAGLVAVLAAGVARDASAQANVLSIGDVSPTERPFVPGEQGIPTAGSTVFEDGVDANGNPVDIFGDPLIDEDGNVVGQFNYERSVNIEVGRFSTGQVVMSGGAALRVGDLIIGGDTSAEVQASNLNINGGDFGTGGAGGSGTVEISGNGTYFNSHPLIIETQYQDLANPERTVFAIPTTYNPGFDLGGVTGAADLITDIARPGTSNVVGGTNSNAGEFDLYVGLTGNGVLRIADGGRAEIRDGAFIGVAPNAVGRVSVDGQG